MKAELSYKGISLHQSVLNEELKKARMIQELLEEIRTEAELSGRDTASINRDLEMIERIKTSISSRSEFLDWVVDRFKQVSEMNIDEIKMIENQLNRLTEDIHG